MSEASVDKLHWFEVHWPRPLDADRALSLLRSWATEGRNPQLVLEVRGTKVGVTYLLGVPAAAIGTTRASLKAHLPEITLVPAVRRSHPFDLTVSLRASTRHRSLRTDLTQAVVRSTLAALVRTRGQELLVLQIVLGPRRIPMAVPTRAPSSTTGSVWQIIWHGKGQQLDGEKRAALRTKVSGDHGFACTIRLGVCAAPSRRRGLLTNLFSGLRTSEATGVKLQLRRDSSKRAGRGERPLLRWPLRLNCAELLALSGWPLGDEGLPGQSPLRPKRLRPVSGTDGEGRTFAVSAAPGVDAPLGITAASALHHTWVLGPTGSGKSSLFGKLIDDDIRGGRSVFLLEPKGDVVEGVLSRIPAERRGDVVILDPTDLAPVGLNPLAAAGRRPEIVADTMLAVFRQIYGEAIGPRSADILYASLLTVARRPDASLVMLPLLLTNDGFRRSMTQNLNDPIGLEPFWAQFNAWSTGERAAAIAPVLNKLRPILRPTVRAVLGQQKPRFSLRQIFTERKIFLLPLRRGLIGPEAATLLGSLAMAELWQGIQERSAVPAAKRHPVMVYVDEVQDYLHLGTDLGDALAQSRGYGVAFHLAHQFVSQLSTEMRGAITSNARSRIGFQLGHADAVELAKGHGELTADDFMALGQYEIYASAFAAGRVTPYAIGRTLPPGKPISSADELRGLSRERYGRSIEEIEAGFAALLSPDDANFGPTGRRRRRP